MTPHFQLFLILLVDLADLIGFIFCIFGNQQQAYEVFKDCFLLTIEAKLHLLLHSLLYLLVISLHVDYIFVSITGFHEHLFVHIVDHQITIVSDSQIFELTNSFLVDFLANDVQPNIVFLFDHDTHLVEYKLQLFPLIHGTISFNLDFLHDPSSFIDIVFILHQLHTHQTASGIFHFQIYLFF